MLVRDPVFDELRFAGDPRAVPTWGPDRLIDDLCAVTGGTRVDPTALVGPGLTDVARRRLGENLIMPAPGTVILPRGFDKRLRCYHGGLTPEEIEIPLLVR